MSNAVVFMAAGLLAASMAVSPFAASGQVRAAGWQTEWNKTLEASRKEGKVVVSVPASAELRVRVQEAFERRFPGVAVELLAARGSSNINKILDENKAGVHYFDIHIGGTNSMVTGLLTEGLLEPVAPWMILPEVKDPKNWWGGHMWVDTAQRSIYAFQAYLTETVWYNTSMVKPGEIAAYDDLLRPKWKGQIDILDPRTPGSGDSTWAFLWEIKGEEYLKKLVAQNLLIGRNQRQLAESVAKGKTALSLGLSYYVYLPFVKANLPLKPLPAPKEGFYGSSGSGNLAILKNAPHPNAAKVFVNWLFSREGQEIFGRAMGQATRRLDVDTTWLKQFGHIPAKDVMTPESFLTLENQSEKKVVTVREPAAALAHKLLD